MIYLIDDKIERQSLLGWSHDKLRLYQDFIFPIYLYQDINEELKEKIFTNGNVILFHESFFENNLNNNNKDVNEIRTKLEEFAINNKESIYVSFSGSNNSRTFENNSVTLPVSVLYQNLEIFISNYKLTGSYNIENIIYGDNYLLEEKLLELQEDSYSKSFNLNSEQEKIFFLRSRKGFDNPFEGEVEIETIFNKDYSDESIGEKIIKWLNNKEFDKIFIPLCYGKILSDFNGLKLATHIRCTKTINQLKPIYIYSLVGIEYLMENTFFNILKTKNIFIINISIDSFKNSLSQNINPFRIEDLPSEMAKLNLEVPKDYYDNHSIANEWGIYQLARNADISISDVEGFDQKKLETIYFKWLIAKNNLLKPIEEEVKVEQKMYADKLSGLKIIDKIDLSKFSKK